MDKEDEADMDVRKRKGEREGGLWILGINHKKNDIERAE